MGCAGNTFNSVAAPPSGMANQHSVATGDVLYDEDGDVVGVVTATTGERVELETASDPESADRDAVDHEDPPGQEYGEGELMWRCDDCGEMGALEGGIPGACPACGAPGEALYRVEED